MRREGCLILYPAGDIIVVRLTCRAEFIILLMSELRSLIGGGGLRLLISSGVFQNEPLDGAGGCYIGPRSWHAWRG